MGGGRKHVYTVWLQSGKTDAAGQAIDHHNYRSASHDPHNFSPFNCVNELTIHYADVIKETAFMTLIIQPSMDMG